MKALTDLADRLALFNSQPDQIALLNDQPGLIALLKDHTEQIVGFVDIIRGLNDLEADAQSAVAEIGEIIDRSRKYIGQK